MVKFEYPILGSVERTITLPNPELDNADTFEPEMSIYRSRNNTLYTIIKHVRADKVVEDAAYDFNNITPAVAKAARDFFSATAGQYLKYTDHNDDEWVVLLIDPSVKFVSMGIGEYQQTSIKLRKWGAS